MSRSGGLVLAVTALVLAIAPPAWSAPPGSTLLADLPPGVGLGALSGQGSYSSTSGERTVSDDGNRVLFTSESDGLSGADDNRLSNLFVRDRSTGQTFLVNVGVGGAPADAGLYGNAQLSGDGTKAVFASQATNLVAGVPVGSSGIYLRDLTAGTTTLVSRGNGAAGPPASSPGEPAISRDGSTVAFVTQTNVDGAEGAGVGNNDYDVYVRRLAMNVTILVSRATGVAGLVGTLRSNEPSLSASGDSVAFSSNATNLAGAGVTDTNNAGDIFRRSLATNTTTLISKRDGVPTSGNTDSYDPSISPSGSFVAFTSLASDLDSDPGATDGNGSPDVYVRLTFGIALVSRADTATGAIGSSSSSSAAIGVTAASTVLVAFVTGAANLTGAAGGTDQIVLRRLNDGVTEVISANGGAPGDAGSYGPALDLDGTRVAYVTDAQNLGASSGGDFSDVLLRDRSGAGSTELISRASAGVLAEDLTSSDLDHGRRAISADGRYVVFSSGIDALLGALPGDREDHVFRKDLLTGEVVLVDRANGTAGGAGAGCGDASASSDGNVIAFECNGPLDPADVNGDSDVYVRDVAAGTTRLVSRATGPGGAPGDGSSGDPAISGDGLRVAYESSAANLGDGDADTTRDVHLRDLLANTTILVSRADGVAGAKANASAGDPSADADGSVIAFESNATNLGDGDTDTSSDVHVRDLAAGSTRLASRATGGAGVQGNGSSGDVSVSADGLRVAFESSGTNLVPEDTDTSDDILLRDLTTDSTTLVSRADGVAGAKGDASSDDVSLAADGGSAAFETDAANLGGGIDRQVVVVRRLAAATTTLASRADGADGATLASDEQAGDATLSGDASCVAFESRAGTLLPPGVSADFFRIFVRVLARECPFDPPETTIVTGPAGTVATPANTFTFASDEPGSTFECRVDGAAFASCSTPSTTASLPDGAHVFEVRAADRAGFQDPTPAQRQFVVQVPRASTADTTKPRLTGAALSRTRFRVARTATAVAAAKRRRTAAGTTIRYTLSEAATVRMVVGRAQSGRRVGTSCRKATRALRKRKRCTRYLTRGTLRRASKKGTSRVAFSGRIGRKALARGRHRIVLTATDAAGNRSTSSTLAFTIVKG